VIPFRERYRCNTAARFQQIGLNTKTSAANSTSIERAKRSGTSVTSEHFVVLSPPATNANARGNEQNRAATESTTTHHAIRHNNHASPGCFTNFRTARVASFHAGRQPTWSVFCIVVVNASGIQAHDHTAPWFEFSHSNG
jgi:hypothetical protein